VAVDLEAAVLRVAGNPLQNAEAEVIITAMVNVTIPLEPFPFTKRETLREGLRQLVEIAHEQRKVEVIRQLIQPLKTKEVTDARAHQ
jgi:hypothetical protein